MSLPSEWAIVRLKEIVVDIQSGFAQRPSKDEGSTPQIRTHNVSPDGHIDLAGIKYVTPSENELERYSLNPQDIIFNNTNSEEWVGKTALFKLEGIYVFSNHMTRIRVNSQLVEAEYLARYLHFLWRAGYYRQRAKRWVSQAAIDQSALSEFKIALPTIPEQQRIVAISRQADELHRLRREGLERTRQLINVLFIEIFGDPATNPKGCPIAQFGKFVTYSKYGPRFPNREYSGAGARILRTTDMTGDGSIRWWESPILPLTHEELEEHRLKPRTLLISRSGTIGPVAVFEGAEDPCVAGAYLIEFGLSEDIHVEYVKGFFLSDFGQRMLKSRSRSATQANLNAPSIKRIAIPVPNFERQADFANRLREIRFYLDQQVTTLQSINNLKNSLTSEAFSGSLTFAWRATQRHELEAAACARDAALGRTADAASVTEVAPVERQWLSQPERYWLMNQLSWGQGAVWEALQTWPGTLIPAEELDEFRVQCFSNGFLDNINAYILRALDQLAALGLVVKVSMPNQQGEYVTGYRGLREDELSYIADRQVLAET